MKTPPSQARSGKEKRVWFTRAQAVGRSIKKAMNNPTPTTKAELPERLSFNKCTIQGDGRDAVVLSSLWSGRDYSERTELTKRFAAELVRRYNQYEEMRQFVEGATCTCTKAMHCWRCQILATHHP